MTLQQIADYAMEYLDSKGVAAEYGFDGGAVWVITDEKKVFFVECIFTTASVVRGKIDKYLI